MKKVLIIISILFSSLITLYAGGRMIIDTFPSGITGWSGSGWNATGSISDETSIVYEGDHSLKTTYNITASWGNYGAGTNLKSPKTNWKGYKYLIFYILGKATESDANNDIEVFFYNGTNDEVWYYSDKSLVNTKYYKQVKLKLGTTNGGVGVFMDVDWDDDLYSNAFILTNIVELSFLVGSGATAVGKGDFWIDNIYITSNENFKTAELIYPSNVTGLSKNSTVKIRIGYNMSNIVCQLVDASNNYYKYEVGDSVINYSDDILTINFTNLKSGKNTIAVDAVDKSTGAVLNQFVKDLYVGDYYVIDNFENSDKFISEVTTPYEGTSDILLSTNIYNNEYGGHKAMRLQYSTPGALKSSGIRFTFDEARDFSDFSVLRLYVKGDIGNTGSLNVAFYDNDNNKLDLNYNEDDYCGWTGSDEIEKNSWIKIDIPLNSGSFIDGNTPADNSGYPSGNQLVEFNKIECLDIYITSSSSACSGIVYIDDIMLLKGDYSFVTVNTNNEDTSTQENISVNNFKSIFDVRKNDNYTLNIVAPSSATVKIKIIDIDGRIISEKEYNGGNIIFEWNGKENGREVESGIYFIKVISYDENSNSIESTIKRIYLLK